MDKPWYLTEVEKAFNSGVIVLGNPDPAASNDQYFGNAYLTGVRFHPYPIWTWDHAKSMVLSLADRGFDDGKKGVPPTGYTPSSTDYSFFNETDIVAALQGVYTNGYTAGAAKSAGDITPQQQNPPAEASNAGWWALGIVGVVAAVAAVGFVVAGRKHNPAKGKAVAKHGGYKYAITYDVVTPESAEDGDFADSGWEHEWEQSPTFKSLADLLHYVQNDHGWSEWSSSHPHPGAWIMSYGDTDYSDGSETTYALHIRHADDTELTTAELRYINDKLKLRGHFGR